MTMILRLDPARPMLWLDADRVRFGHDADHALTVSSTWQMVLLHELARGLPESGIDVWAEANSVRRHDARAFVGRLGRALMRTRLPGDAPELRRRAWIDVEHGRGSSPVVRSVRLALECLGWLVHLRERGRAAAPVPAADLAVVIADHALSATMVHEHLIEDRRHALVVSTGSSVTVGPLVVPGSSACATCLDLFRRDDDPAWPTLMAQLSAAAPAPVDAALALSAGSALARLIGTGTTDESLTLTGTTRTRRRHTRHPECGCRADLQTMASVHPAA